MESMLKVSSNPHVRSKATTARIMQCVVIALLPATIFGVINFGLHALFLVLVTVGATVTTEYIYEKLMKKKITISDFSAVVTGLLLALNLPPRAPWWIGVIGGVFAILVVKMLFGGLGQNFMNPALGARCFLLISFAGKMTTFTYDGITGATPLAILKEGGNVDILKMFLGTTSGVIGETSTVALLIGGAYLLIKKVIAPTIPFVYIAVFSVFVLIFGGQGFDMSFLAAHLCGGGLMLGAFFMATDYVTSPVNTLGKVVYAFILGLLTAIFRVFGNSAEGVSYAIIFTNLLVPIIEKITRPRAFGVKRVKKEAAE